MERPPRKPEERLFSRKTLLLSFLQGASVLLIVVGVFIVARLRGEPETNVRALAFTTLIIANLALILANRSWNRIIVATLRVPEPDPVVDFCRFVRSSRPRALCSLYPGSFPVLDVACQRPSDPLERRCGVFFGQAHDDLERKSEFTALSGSLKLDNAILASLALRPASTPLPSTPKTHSAMDTK